jgi:SsrA-binding protein
MGQAPEIYIRNKKASFEFQLLDKFLAGLVLTGTEIKSIRANNASIAEAYCIIHHDEVWVKNMHIAEYDKGGHFNHEPKRDRKLLLQKREIKKLLTKLKDKGLTLIPTLLYINEKGLAKLEIHLAKGKKNFDKREDIKLKDMKRDLDRKFK